MIEPSKYNGINFSASLSRKNNIFNYDNQRIKNFLPVDDPLETISFFVSGYLNTPAVILKCILSSGTELNFNATTVTTFGDGKIYYFVINPNFLPINEDVLFCLLVNSDRCYSEYYRTTNLAWMAANDISKVYSFNNDNKYGFTYEQIFGFFRMTAFDSDRLLTKKKEYEYSYSRKLLLSAENQISKRFTFHDLTMYNKNLLKWICNCNNLYINDVKYQLVSEFTELLADVNTEIVSLQADFVEADQSFFEKGNTERPKYVFERSFFM